MAIKYAIEKHGVAYPSKCLATQGGAHIYNIIAAEDIDQGWFVGKGSWATYDQYEEAAPTSATGIVRDVAANGNYYVEITATDNAYMVYTVPMIDEEYNHSFTDEANFFNAEGDVMRCYELHAGDIVELSEKAFAAKPSATGVTVSLKAISGKTAMQFGE